MMKRRVSGLLGMVVLLALTRCSSTAPTSAPAHAQLAAMTGKEASATPSPSPLARTAAAHEFGIEVRPLRSELAVGEALEFALHLQGPKPRYDDAFFLQWAQGMTVTLANNGTQIWQGTTQAVKLKKAAGGHLDGVGIRLAALGAAGLAVDVNMVAKFSTPWPRLAPGEYTVTLTRSEALASGGGKDPTLSTQRSMRFSVVSDVKPGHEALAIARAAALAANPGKSEAQYVEAGFVPSVVLSGNKGERVVRFALWENRTAGFGFRQTTVVLNLKNEVLSHANERVDTCLAEDAWVRLADGSRRLVRELVVGDRIWGYDVRAQRAVVTTVEFVEAVTKQTRLVQLSNGLRTTPEHPVWNGREFTAAGELPLALDAWLPSGLHTVYNLGVSSPHTYFANDLLMHNKDRGYRDELDDAWLFMWKDLPVP